MKNKQFIQLSATLKNGINIKMEKVTDITSKFIVTNEDTLIHEEICLKQHALETLLSLKAKYQ